MGRRKNRLLALSILDFGLEEKYENGREESDRAINDTFLTFISEK